MQQEGGKKFHKNRAILKSGDLKNSSILSCSVCALIFLDYLCFIYKLPFLLPFFPPSPEGSSLAWSADQQISWGMGAD